MSDKYIQKILLGLIHAHILHHANREPFYGLWMIEELKSHGYNISPGTLYPLLHKMHREGLLEINRKTIDSKVRKYYSITPAGRKVLDACRDKIREAYFEIAENGREKK